VPAGLSEAEWKARQKDEAAKKAANKLKYPKGPPFLGVKEYLTGLANKQTFKNGKVKDTGHVYVKTKYDWSGAKKDGSVRYNSVAGESDTKKKNPFFKKDIADASALQGFVSNYMPSATQRMPTSLNAYVPAGLSEAEWKARQKDEAAKKAANKLKYPKGPPFLGVKEYLTGLANKQTFKNGKVKDTGHVYVKTKYDWSGAKKDGSVRYNVDPKLNKFVLPAVSNVKHGNGPDALAGTSPFKIVDDTPVLHPATQVQDSTSFTPMSLAAIGIGLLSLVTVLGFRLHRGMQPAAILASSAGLGSDMPLNMELKSQDSHVKGTPVRVGWGQLSSQNSHPLTPCYAAESKADLVALQNSLPGPPSYWDPLNLGGNATLLEDYGFDYEKEDGTMVSFRIDTEEKAIGWFRHAEIKHGRVAMAAVLGFIAQCTPTVSGEHTIAPYRGYIAGCTPQEQWDNIPLVGKLQILTLVGMLESYGEGAGSPEGYVHYTKGGKPGYYPPIKGRGSPWGGQILFNLWDPFGISKVQKLSEESKARRLQVELQNGRLAMIGIMGFLAASSVPGSVPFLANIEGYPQYAGNVMVPFSNDFSIGATIYGS